jgi:shikimate kinase
LDERGRQERGVALGGFMGTGKTTVGRLLAQRLGLPFVDTDAILAARHGPVVDQIRVEGEAVFRARERTLVEELVAGPAVVVATGGGLWVDPANREALGTVFDRVVLVAPLEILRERVGGDPARPLWDEGVAARYEARRAAYADADLVVDTSRRDPLGIVEEIVAWRQSS